MLWCEQGEKMLECTSCETLYPEFRYSKCPKCGEEKIKNNLKIKSKHEPRRRKEEENTLHVEFSEYRLKEVSS